MFKDGLEEGRWIEYFESNGKKALEGNYLKG